MNLGNYSFEHLILKKCNFHLIGLIWVLFFFFFYLGWTGSTTLFLFLFFSPFFLFHIALHCRIKLLLFEYCIRRICVWQQEQIFYIRSVRGKNNVKKRLGGGAISPVRSKKKSQNPVCLRKHIVTKLVKPYQLIFWFFFLKMYAFKMHCSIIVWNIPLFSYKRSKKKK